MLKFQLNMLWQFYARNAWIGSTICVILLLMIFKPRFWVKTVEFIKGFLHRNKLMIVPFLLTVYFLTQVHQINVSLKAMSEHLEDIYISAPEVTE